MKYDYEIWMLTGSCLAFAGEFVLFGVLPSVFFSELASNEVKIIFFYYNFQKIKWFSVMLIVNKTHFVSCKAKNTAKTVNRIANEISDRKILNKVNVFLYLKLIF